MAQGRPGLTSEAALVSLRKWELARTPDTKVTGALKVGSKVTVNYTMTAKAITVK
jgi:hypothetical protein